MSKETDFVNGVTVVDESFLDAVQEVMTGLAHNFILEKQSSTAVRVVAGSANSQASITIMGQMRYTTVTKSLTLSGAANTYNIYATADTLDRDFALEQSSGASAATYYRKIGEVVWDGSAITSMINLAGPAPTNDPTLTGTVTIPSPASGSDTTVAASTEWVRDRIGDVAPAAHASSHLPGASDALAWSASINMAGTYASRPAASSSNAGLFYYVTDMDALYRSTGSAWVRIGAHAGTLVAFAGAVAPNGTEMAYGQAVSRSGKYTDLFNAIGTTFGVGDGSTTFNLPDMRGRIPVALDNMGGSDAGVLTMANTLGLTGGEEKHLLTSSESGLPDHTHSDTLTFNLSTGIGSNGSYAGGPGQTSSAFQQGINGSVTGVTGGAQNASSSHNNMQPYLLSNWIIKL